MSGPAESMDESRPRQAEVAALLGVIERMAGDLALAEEPARFVAALEAGRPSADAEAGGGGRPR